MVSESEDSRIVFVGAERVGRATLERLFETDHDVVGVVTAADDRRDDIADWVSFDDLMTDRDVPYHKVDDSNSEEFVNVVTDLDPDVVFVISWSFLIPPEVIEYPPQGVVGLHYSLLPERRGGAPLNWALIDGLDETGVSLFYMEEELDTGDVIAQRRFEIAHDDTVKDLLDEIVDIAPELVAEYVDDIVRGTAPRHEQDESAATYTEARSPEDSAIDWDQSLEDLYNFVRALAPPYPSAFAIVDGRRFVVPAATFDGETLEIQGYFEEADAPPDDGGTLVNTTASLSDPESLAAEIRTAPDDSPVVLSFGARSVALTDASIQDDRLHASGVVR